MYKQTLKAPKPGALDVAKNIPDDPTLCTIPQHHIPVSKDTPVSIPPRHGKPTSTFRLSQQVEDDMCEAYVTLGRLSHVKKRHGETTLFMAQSLVDAGVDNAVEAAMAKVRGEVSSAIL